MVTIASRLLRPTAAAAYQLPRFISTARFAPTTVSTLGNGLRVASENSGGETATIGVWIDVGSRCEDNKTNGVAHFLEHMAFKGTTNRSKSQLEKEVEDMGAHLNAYTSREQTVYYAKVFKKDVPKAVEILSDILQNSTFDQASIDRERDVILRESEEIEGQIEEVLFDRLHETAFQGTPLARTILGPEANVRSITRDDLTNYIATHYTAPNMVVVGAGAVEHQQLADLSDKAFAKVSSKANPVPVEKSIFTGSEFRERNDDHPLVNFALAWEGASWTSPDAHALMVAQSVLGCWTKGSHLATHGEYSTSKLCMEVSSGDLGNSIMSFNTMYSDTGLFGVYGSCNEEQAEDFLWQIQENVVRLCHDVTDAEIDRAKQQLKVSLLMGLDNTSAVAEDIGRQILTYGRRLSTAELFARIDAVDAKTLRDVCHRHIHDKDVAFTALGPLGKTPDYNWLRRRTFWLRY